MAMLNNQRVLVEILLTRHVNGTFILLQTLTNMAKHDLSHTLRIKKISIHYAALFMYPLV